MESVCEVIGYESVFDKDSGESTGVRVYCQRPLDSENVIGAGVEAIREYVNSKYVKYDPHIGDHVVFIKNARGYVERVIKF